MVNIYDPDITDSQLKEYAKYVALEYKLKKLCEWVDFLDYIYSYGMLDFKDKTVLDIGSDIGSSAIYFIDKGAKFVYLIENNDTYIRIYYTLRNKYYREYPQLQYTELISKDKIPNNIDILKMDCEGCELEYISKEFLDRFKMFSIGLHKDILGSEYDRLKEIVESSGGKYIGSVNNSEFIYVKL